MSGPLSGLHLLVVEDEAMVALMVEDILTDLGCTGVEVAGTVGQGLAMVKNPRPLDGAILDVNIGGEKVYPVAEALEAKGVPFIFATGYGIAGISEAFSHVPAIAKPYEPRTLERLLASTLNRPTSGSS